VVAAADAAVGFLEPLVGRDWSRGIPGLDFTVASVNAHAAAGPLWYAVDFTARRSARARRQGPAAPEGVAKAVGPSPASTHCGLACSEI
jgi:hypothetical protein